MRFALHADPRQAHAANAGHRQRFGGMVPPRPAVVNNVSYRAQGPVAYSHLAAAETCFYGHTVAGA